MSEPGKPRPIEVRWPSGKTYVLASSRDNGVEQLVGERRQPLIEKLRRAGASVIEL